MPDPAPPAPPDPDRTVEVTRTDAATLVNAPRQVAVVASEAARRTSVVLG
jgi:hypothetical protein